MSENNGRFSTAPTFHNESNTSFLGIASAVISSSDADNFGRLYTYFASDVPSIRPKASVSPVSVFYQIAQKKYLSSAVLLITMTKFYSSRQGPK